MKTWKVGDKCRFKSNAPFAWGSNGGKYTREKENRTVKTIYKVHDTQKNHICLEPDVNYWVNGEYDIEPVVQTIIVITNGTKTRD